jgi:adenylate cyclase
MLKNQIEIERKFLVKQELIDNTKVNYIDITQSYITKNNNGSLRIRIEKCRNEEHAYIMSKTKISESSLENFETIDEINVENALLIINKFGTKIINKRRYLHVIDNKLWEVDYFTKPNELVLAEIELKSIDEEIKLPIWIDKEVTGNPMYYNSNM